jgi:ferric-dicitrate binding protein FerR (iron transport regulator)
MLCSGPSQGQDDQGTVIALRNRAEACPAASPCRRLDFGSKVVNGDSLKTYERSRLTVRFASGSRLDMGPNSVLVMASLQPDGKATSLRWGEFDFEVKKPDSKGRFKVRTPVAVAAAEGTRFRVEVDTLTGNSRVRLDEGSLRIVPEDPSLPEFKMRSGELLDMKIGSLPILRNQVGSVSSDLSGSSGPDILPVPVTLVPKEPQVETPSSGVLHIEVVP